MKQIYILSLSELLWNLINQATETSTVEELAHIALAAKPLIDKAGLHPDLGLELLTFANLKRDGRKEESETFAQSARNIIESLKKNEAS